MRLNGYALREIRTRSGLTVTEAARLAGVKQPTWSNWERGERNATSDNLLLICEVLEIKDYRAILANPGSVDIKALVA